jgi:hypothetical protein
MNLRSELKERHLSPTLSPEDGGEGDNSQAVG